MKAYELLFFVAPVYRRRESRAAVMKRIETTIAAGKGTVDNVDVWGKRKLAYEINGLTDGDYTLIDFHAESRKRCRARSRSAHHRCRGASHDRRSARIATKEEIEDGAANLRRPA